MNIINIMKNINNYNNRYYIIRRSINSILVEVLYSHNYKPFMLKIRDKNLIIYEHDKNDFRTAMLKDYDSLIVETSRRILGVIYHRY